VVPSSPALLEVNMFTATTMIPNKASDHAYHPIQPVLRPEEATLPPLFRRAPQSQPVRPSPAALIEPDILDAEQPAISLAISCPLRTPRLLTRQMLRRRYCSCDVGTAGILLPAGVCHPQHEHNPRPEGGLHKDLGRRVAPSRVFCDATFCPSPLDSL
jgi:hypothetical protein